MSSSRVQSANRRVGSGRREVTTYYIHTKQSNQLRSQRTGYGNSGILAASGNPPFSNTWRPLGALRADNAQNSSKPHWAAAEPNSNTKQHSLSYRLKSLEQLLRERTVKVRQLQQDRSGDRKKDEQKPMILRSSTDLEIEVRNPPCESPIVRRQRAWVQSGLRRSYTETDDEIATQTKNVLRREKSMWERIQAKVDNMVEKVPPADAETTPGGVRQPSAHQSPRAPPREAFMQSVTNDALPQQSGGYLPRSQSDLTGSDLNKPKDSSNRLPTLAERRPPKSALRRTMPVGARDRINSGMLVRNRLLAQAKSVRFDLNEDVRMITPISSPITVQPLAIP